MTFWQLVSIFRSNPLILEKLLQDSGWHLQLNWLRNLDHHVKSQNRQILDAVVTDDLAMSAMRLCQHRFRIQEGFLSQCTDNFASPGSLAAVDVYKRYGGAAIEEVLE